MTTPPPLKRPPAPRPFAQNNDRIWWIFAILAALLGLLLLLLLLLSAFGGSGTGLGGTGQNDGTEASEGADGAAAEQASSSDVDGKEGDSQESRDDAKTSDQQAGSEEASETKGDGTGGADTAEKEPLGEKIDQQTDAEKSESPIPAAQMDIVQPEEPPANEKSGAEVGLFSRPKAGLFGINVVAEKVAYVLDVSSSMGGGLPSGSRKQVRANEELMNSVKQLANSQTMTIVMYNTGPIFDQQFIRTKATDKAKGDLQQWLNNRMSHGGTDPIGAMQMVLKDEYDAIFLVSDGEFHGGAPAQIKSMNQHNTVIHTIALNANSQTLQQIAKDSGGQFIVVK